MDSIDAVNVIRDFMREYVADPYVTAGGKARLSWIFTDDPFSSATYPRIKISIHNHTSRPIDIGPDYTNWENVVVKIQFFTKQDFKVVLNNTIYTNEQLVSKYQNIIHDTLKSKFNELYASGVKAFKLIGMSTPSYEPNYQCHNGYILCNFWLFRR